MNREIRFRGLTINTKRWVYGYLAEIETNWDYYNGYGLPTEYSKVIISTEYTTREAVDIIPETVGQYTGLKDKNGKEIYEGDIIQLINEDLEEIRVVCEFGTARRQIFDNLVEITGFYFKRLFDDRKTFPIVNNYLGKHDLELFEVVGNIYENPELLKANNED